MKHWTLEDICRDFHEWPWCWMGLPEDKTYGEGLLNAMHPFVDRLLTSNLTKKTVQRHLDNLWLLGGEIIREVNMHNEYRISPLEKLFRSIDSNGGPPCRHLDSETKQKSFDNTCRKLHGFLKNMQKVCGQAISEEDEHAWDVRKRGGNCLPIKETIFNKKYEDWAKRNWIPWLQDNLSFPFEVKRKEDDDDAYFTDVAKREPFRLGHTMKVIAVLDEEMPFRGIIVKVREGRKVGYVPLCDLEVTDKSDPNYWPVREYVVWDANK